jgi:inositol 1,4,5-triphosphate receptor type 1
VRAEGDPIRVNDQIVFESIKTSGQYLHSSLLPHPETEPDAGYHEINVSVTQTAYTVLAHQSHKLTELDDLKGGDVIQLYHKEVSAYVCAEGIYTRDTP